MHRHASFFVFSGLMFVSVPVVWGHGNNHQHMEEKPAQSNANDEALKLASAIYEKDIKSIFKKSCFDCHATPTNLPWYYNLPVAQKIIDNDMREAKKHLDMSDGFPFKGHGGLKEDLAAIKEVVKGEKMPPFRYKVLHWQSTLDPKEKEIVLGWIRTSMEKLQDFEKKPTQL